MSLRAVLTDIWSGVLTADSAETEVLDFKREQRSIRDTQIDIADAAVCFANGAGGVVVVGVEDKGVGPAAFSGTNLDAGALRRKIYDVTEPPLDVQVEEIEFEGHRLLAVQVREGLDVHLRHGRTPTRRSLTDCLPLGPAEISRLHDERTGKDWSAGPSAAALDDVLPETMVQLRGLLRQGGRGTSIADRSDADLCASLGLTSSDGVLNRAGELLLSPGDDEVVVYQYRTRAGGEVSYGRRWTRPLLTAFLETMAVAEARIGTTPVSLSNGQQLQIQDYPVIAVREAVANAVMHGDHRTGQPVSIEHSPQMLEVRSPGPLVTGISPANILTHPPKPRFPALAEALRSMGLAEKWGQGVDRMFREMIRTGRDTPRVAVLEGQEPETSVRFAGGPPNSRVTRFVSSLPYELQDDTDVLLIVSVLMDKRSVSATSLASVVQREPDAVQLVLHGLATADEPLIEATPRTARRARPDYRLTGTSIAALGSALAYQARPRADRDRKVMAHVREYGWINNGTLQRMFDLDVQAASEYLKGLVGREVLVRTSEQTRGTAVRYGPGASFPRTGR